VLGADDHCDRLTRREAERPLGSHLRSPVERHPVPAAVGRADRAGEPVRLAHEISDEQGRRAPVDLLRRTDLFQHAVVHHRHPVRHREGFFLIVGDVDECDADATLDVLELTLEFLAELEIQGAEGLVQQQHLRVLDQRPGEGHPLLLSSGELPGPGALATRQLHQCQHLGSALPDFLLRQPLLDQTEGDVGRHIEVGKQRVALENGIYRPPIGRDACDVSVANVDMAGIGILEPGDETKRGRLPASARPDDREEPALRDRQVQGVDGDNLAEGLAQPFQPDERVVH
jgi:hypothetical protein